MQLGMFVGLLIGYIRYTLLGAPLWKAFLVPLRASKVKAATMSACLATAAALSTASAPRDEII